MRAVGGVSSFQFLCGNELTAVTTSTINGQKKTTMLVLSAQHTLPQPVV
jgi:hypothetical protein